MLTTDEVVEFIVKSFWRSRDPEWSVVATRDTNYVAIEFGREPEYVAGSYLAAILVREDLYALASGALKRYIKAYYDPGLQVVILLGEQAFSSYDGETWEFHDEPPTPDVS